MPLRVWLGVVRIFGDKAEDVNVIARTEGRESLRGSEGPKQSGRRRSASLNAPSATSDRPSVTPQPGSVSSRPASLSSQSPTANSEGPCGRSETIIASSVVPSLSSRPASRSCDSPSASSQRPSGRSGTTIATSAGPSARFRAPESVFHTAKCEFGADQRDGSGGRRESRGPKCEFQGSERGFWAATRCSRAPGRGRNEVLRAERV